jgi:hypothetical protein
MSLSFHQTASDSAPEYFLGEINTLGRPSFLSLVSSVFSHAAVIGLLMTVRFPVAQAAPASEAERKPTEIRIENKLYYVADISGLGGPAKRSSPIAAAEGRSPSVKPAPALTLPEPPKIAGNLNIPPLPEPELKLPEPEPAPAEPKRGIPRTFIPPEVKRAPIAEQTLIQPQSPPDLVPPPTQLPSFRVMTTQSLPKLPKPFVSPGRPEPVPPAPVPTVTPLPEELVSARPVPAAFQARLTLPRTPPPPEPPKPNAPDVPPPTPAGDSLNIMSLTNRDTPLKERLIVPPGNVAQEAGADTRASASGTAMNLRRSGPGDASPTSTTTASTAPASTAPASAAPASAAPAPTATARSASSSATESTRSGAASSNSTSKAADRAATSTAGATAASAANPSEPGKGRGANGEGSGAAPSGVTKNGDPTAVAVGPARREGSTDPSAKGNAPSGSGTGTGTPGGGIIVRAPNGAFDTMVVQSSSLDQYPEGRALLTGRPIYSVYISAGTARDWTLFFCIPNSKPAPLNGPVVQLGASAAQVSAPFPTKLVKPAITLPSWEKYVLVYGVVTPEGHVENLRVVRSIQPEIDKALLASLADWEFRSAKKDGVAVSVEFLLSIPAKGL